MMNASTLTPLARATTDSGGAAVAEICDFAEDMTVDNSAGRIEMVVVNTCPADELVFFPIRRPTCHVESQRLLILRQCRACVIGVGGVGQTKFRSSTSSRMCFLRKCGCLYCFMESQVRLQPCKDLHLVHFLGGLKYVGLGN